MTDENTQGEDIQDEAPVPTPAEAAPLTTQDINNILNIMSRVDLKGNEAHAYVTCDMKLRVMLKQLEALQPPPPK